jgi:hypothetical protein
MADQAGDHDDKLWTHWKSVGLREKVLIAIPREERKSRSVVAACKRIQFLETSSVVMDVHLWKNDFLVIVMDTELRLIPKELRYRK